MDLSILSIIVTLAVTAIIGGMKYFERKYGSNPEVWDYQKFAMLLIVAFIVMLGEYALGQTSVFPSEDILGYALMIFGAAYGLLTGGKLVTNVVTGKPSGGYAGWLPGFSVRPTFSKGISPYSVTLTVNGGNLPETEKTGVRCGLAIDWMDGSPIEEYKLDSAGYANVSHTYKYEKGASKYTGHSFYPVFRMIFPDGTYQEFNVQGKACEIEVQSA